MRRTDSDQVFRVRNQAHRHQDSKCRAHLGRVLLVLRDTEPPAVRIGATLAHRADVWLFENKVAPVPCIRALALGNCDDRRVAIVWIVSQRSDRAADELEYLSRVAHQIFGREQYDLRI